jgi:hypothetical protein
MMNRMNILPKNAIEEQRKHPLAYALLMFAMLSPMVVGITVIGILLKRCFPAPDLGRIAAGGCFFVLAIPILMCAGAACWLIVSRRFVPRSVAQAFFVQPGFGILSSVSEWMFAVVYGANDDERGDLTMDESRQPLP